MSAIWLPILVRRLETLNRLSDDADRLIKVMLLLNPSRTPGVVDKLHSDSDKDIRILCARSDDASAEVLASLSKDLNEEVRLRVARNAVTPSSLPNRWLKIRMSKCGSLWQTIAPSGSQRQREVRCCII